MIEKKLVEKDVEVTVVEKRLVEMYNYNNEEYTKDGLVCKLKGEMLSIGDSICGQWSKKHRCNTGWQKMYQKTDRDFFVNLYKALEKKMKLIESLDNDVDKD
jgi:hypothetical protein